MKGLPTCPPVPGILRLDTAEAEGGHLRTGLALCGERLPGAGPHQPRPILASPCIIEAVSFLLAQACATAILQTAWQPCQQG